MQLSKQLAKVLGQYAGQPLSIEEIHRHIGRKGVGVADVAKAVGALQRQGRVAFRDGGYVLTEPQPANVGLFQANPKGYGFVSLPDGDVFVPPPKVGGAMHGDKVRVRLLKRRRGATVEAAVVEVLERANRRIVGRFERRRHFAIVTPANNRIFYEVTVPIEHFADADTGDIVILEIERWPTDDILPEGRVVEVVGREGAPGLDITMILLARDWPTEFPSPALTEAEAIGPVVTAEDTRGRLDLRDWFTVTIDGLDAKDFDDAISLEVDEAGYFHLGVHIADVSHYVAADAPVDREAVRRATSVYLPDRVVPMLPPALSTGICSLNPLVDRLAFSLLMDVNPDGEVEKFEARETVIRSDARLTYEEVDEHLVSGIFKAPELERILLAMQLLSQVLEKKRAARGSLNFETIEPKVILDRQLQPVEIKIRERTPATQLIEETMILTNETVAEYMLSRDAPMIYRIHERPDPDAVFAVNQLVRELGYPLKSVERAHPRTFQALLDFAHTRPEKVLINTLLLRAMARAKYSPVLVSHFGLAAEHYCHFTSPIRRYPDLMVHRLVKATLANRLDEPQIRRMVDGLDELAEYCSVRERLAEEAEREATEIKIAEYMVREIGNEFDAVISGVTGYGFFVELENTAEGLVHIRTLTDDYYRFEGERYWLRGERTGRTFRLGQHARVKLVNVSVTQRQLDFVVV